MDQDKFIALLNEDLETEYQSIVQYVHHIATMEGAEFQSLKEELQSHLSQELNHALTLAEQIDFLGGSPTVSVPNVNDDNDTRGALEADLDLERRQLERYRERVQQAEELGLMDVVEAINPLLEETQDHVRELQKALAVNENRHKAEVS